MRRGKGMKNFIVLVLTMAVLLMAGCGQELVFTTGFGPDQVFQVGDTGCTTAEMMVYLLSTQGQYEKAYGDGIWEANLGESTLEEEVKDSVLEKAAQIKTMYLMALGNELVLEDARKEKCKQAAEIYLQELGTENAVKLGITEELVARMFEEYALANMVYDTILAGVTPEISDDEARIITVQHILFRTYEKDASGNRVNYSEEKKQELLQETYQVLDLAKEGGHDFAELAARYSDDPTIQYSFAKGEMDASFEEASFLLAAGEISDVVESESGYHIIKCLNTLDRERTDANKLLMMESRRNEVFGKEYDAFVEKLARRVNTALWEDFGFLEKEIDSKPNFFEIYENNL